MLNQFELTKASAEILPLSVPFQTKGMTSSPLGEFNQAQETYTEQLFPQQDTDINELLATHEAFSSHSGKLTASQAWYGERQKSERPQHFTQGIVAAVVLPDSIVETKNHKAFFRLSLQPSWVSGQYVVVKEETHVLEEERKVIFLGREVIAEEVRQYLLPALLTQAPLQRVLNAQEKGLGDKMGSEERAQYIQQHFESLFLKEKPALFHVAHGIKGTEEKPIETWLLVRLAPPATISERPALDQLRKNIANGKNIRMYQQTLKELESKKTSVTTVKLSP